LFGRGFDGAGNVRADIAGDVLASIITMHWNGPAKGWNAGTLMDEANFNRRQTICAGASVAYAQVVLIGFDGSRASIAAALRAAGGLTRGAERHTATASVGPAGVRGRGVLGSAEPGTGATSLIDVTVSGARAGDLPEASLVSLTRFIELDAVVWLHNTVRVTARNTSGAKFDLATATLSVGVAERRVAWALQHDPTGASTISRFQGSSAIAGARWNRQGERSATAAAGSFPNTRPAITRPAAGAV